MRKLEEEVFVLRKEREGMEEALATAKKQVEDMDKVSRKQKGKQGVAETELQNIQVPVSLVYSALLLHSQSANPKIVGSFLPVVLHLSSVSFRGIGFFFLFLTFLLFHILDN